MLAVLSCGRLGYDSLIPPTASGDAQNEVGKNTDALLVTVDSNPFASGDGPFSVRALDALDGDAPGANRTLDGPDLPVDAMGPLPVDATETRVDGSTTAGSTGDAAASGPDEAPSRIDLAATAAPPVGPDTGPLNLADMAFFNNPNSDAWTPDIAARDGSETEGPDADNLEPDVSPQDAAPWDTTPPDMAYLDITKADVAEADAAGADAAADAGMQDALPGGPSFIVGSFVKSTVTTVPTLQTISHGLGSPPRALVMWTVGATDTAVVPDYRFGMGLSDGPSGTSRAWAMASQDGVTRTKNSRAFAAKAIAIIQWGQITVAEADLVAWDDLTIQLRWTTNDNVARVIHYMVVGGPDVKAKVVTWNAPTTPSQVNVNGVGFAPEVVLHLGGGSGYTAPPPSSDIAAILLLGAMDARGGQWTVSPNAINGQKPSDTQRIQSSSSCLQAIDATLAVHKDARFAGMTSDGFALDFITASGSASQMVSLAISGVSARVGSFNKSPAAAPARQQVAGHGFRPGLLMMASWQAPAGAPGPHSRFGLGASDGLRSGAIAFTDENGANLSSVRSVGQNDVAFLKADDALGTVQATAQVASYDADGFSLDWTINDAVSTEILFLSLGPPR